MKADEREIKRKRRILDHAVEIGNVAKTFASLPIAVARTQRHGAQNDYQNRER